VHFCLADESASNVETFEKTFRAVEDITPPCVAMVEGNSCAHVRRAAEAITKALAPRPIETAIYQLEQALANSDCNCNCRHSIADPSPIV